MDIERTIKNVISFIEENFAGVMLYYHFLRDKNKISKRDFIGYLIVLSIVLELKSDELKTK